MGIINFIKNKFLSKKVDKLENKYLNLSFEELKALEDYELFMAIDVKTYTKVEKNDFNFLNEHEKVFYVINYFDTEVMNGGLCQFFVNSCRTYAPYISDFLDKLNAKKHKKLFDSFIKKNKINLEYLDDFESDNAEEFISQYDKYPFDEFDLEYYELESIQTFLLKYIKENIINFK